MNKRQRDKLEKLVSLCEQAKRIPEFLIKSGMELEAEADRRERSKKS